MRIALALDAERAERLRADLPAAGLEAPLVVRPADLPGIVRAASRPAAAGTTSALHDVDALVLPAQRRLLDADLLAACDRAGVRILLLGDDAEGQRLARRHGLPAPLPADASAWRLAEAVADGGSAAAPTAIEREPRTGRVLAVWGPHGAPGRSSIAIELAAALAGDNRSVALVDADSHAPSLALLLGLADDGPGLAAACRRAETGGLDTAELTRLAVAVDTHAGPIDVLTGLNRPARWPELSPSRLRATLRACREWSGTTVVDISAPLEADEELMSDLSVPRRNAAARTALEEADHILAVTGADALSLARFVRAYAELRALVGPTPVTVVVNRVRTGPLGIDARGQIRRALDRFSGISDIRFLPDDPRALDTALLHARPVCEVAPRSGFAAAIRQLVGALERTDPEDTAGETATPRRRRRQETRPGVAGLIAGSRRGSSRAARSRR